MLAQESDRDGGRRKAVEPIRRVSDEPPWPPIVVLEQLFLYIGIASRREQGWAPIEGINILDSVTGLC
jgi:hypothetical protein